MHSSIIVFALFAVVASAHPGIGMGMGFGRDFKELMGQLTDAQRQELRTIFQNMDATRAQTKQAVKEWVAKQDEKIK
jgi:hypothetical protein